MAIITTSIEYIDDEGDEQTLTIPAKYEVCGRCYGKGKHDHPAFANGITSSEWNSPDWDDDSHEAYIRGDYDVQCTVCNGERVVPVPDYDRLTPEQLTIVENWQRYQAEAAAERRSQERYQY